MAEAATGKKRSRKGKEDDAIVMDGQTEEERRLLRQTQRELYDRIQSKKQDMTSLDSTTFENMKDDNNELFKKVRFTREAHYDAENFKLITQAAVKRSEQLTTSSSTYSPARLVEALHRHGWSDEGGAFNWRGLGGAVAVVFRTPPEMNFLCGAVDKPEKEKKARAARKEKAADDDVTETQFEEIKEDDEKEEEATNHRAEEMGKILATRMAEATSAHGNAPGTPRFEVLPTLVNPASFHQTVENFFDFSFRVKQGISCLKIGEDGVPVTSVTEGPEGAVAKTQIVVSLNMSNLKAIQEAWALNESYIPHRKFVDSSGADGGAAASAAGGSGGAASGKKKGKAPARKK